MRSLTGVCAGMRHEYSGGVETPSARPAHVGPFPGMFEGMDLQIGMLREGFAAHVAQERFLPGVDEFVAFQVVVKPKRFVTDCASTG